MDREGQNIKEPWESYQDITKNHTKDREKWQGEIKKLQLPISQAKEKIFEWLKNQAKESAYSTPIKTTQDISGAVDTKLMSKALAKFISIINSATIKDVAVRNDDRIFVSDVYLSKIKDCPILKEKEIKLLRIMSLYDTLKSPPYQVDLNMTTKEEQRKKWAMENEGELRQWLEKRTELENYLKYFGEMKISKNGTLTPPYLEIVE